MEWISVKEKLPDVRSDALIDFARSIIFPSGDYILGDLDGEYVEEMALKYGLLEQKTMNERCGENCLCADLGVGFPTLCNQATRLIRKIK